MNGIFRIGALIASSVIFSGCGVLCIGGTATCGMSDEARYRLLHPKAYGQQWEKKDATTENWRRDWVDCGGRDDGGYGVYSPPQSASEQMQRASREKYQSLAVCMIQKGYVFTGACYDNEIGRRSVACQGRVLTPLR